MDMHNESAQASPAPKFKGELVELGGVTYIVPPLALGALKGGLLKRLQMAEQAEFDLALAMDVVLAALQRNYPGLTMATLDDLPPSALRDIVKVFNAVVRQSKLEPTTSEHAEGAAGNAGPGES